MLNIHVVAPFAAFRTFSTGSYRPTAGFITYSAAYGLLLNIAGIEMRQQDPKYPATLIKKGLPTVKIALGVLETPGRQSIYQQLHNYPVGSTNKENLVRTKYNKNNIAPVRRTFLSNINAYICVKDNLELEQQILEGLSGNITRSYGLPFLGDSNFLPDRLEVVYELQPAKWFIKVNYEMRNIPQQVERLTIKIDRANMAYTRAENFMTTEVPSTTIPEDAWVEVGY
ncbi:CRISPR-associated protein Cas5 [Desulforamulus ferrireducens]|uniref:CRISPR-associated protein Cas5 n=1 Tax=Desulforamulus ferrireducens TaxID=1833852 RepID=A0A1S6IZI0_9FIRM|nr:CRISPR-associated protein Cas5 [Desulforamulus ferrireducens]AQS60186.1 hypothetical protein B0537_14525 [Desulforamulus ferrireducens]